MTRSLPTQSITAILQERLTIAEDALREIASDECMIVLDYDGYNTIDTGIPQRIAAGALTRIKAVGK